LLLYVTLTSGILSALLVNDTICLMLNAASYRGNSPRKIAAVAISDRARYQCDIGSVATLVGNPQNMIIGHFSHISFAQFFTGACTGGSAWARHQFRHFADWFRKTLSEAVIRREARSSTRLDRKLFILVSVVFGLIFAELHCGIRTWLDGPGGRGRW
jgi:Na+/H+ antiporter NhaD/arsenite permease-like protein